MIIIKDAKESYEESNKNLKEIVLEEFEWMAEKINKKIKKAIKKGSFDINYEDSALCHPLAVEKVVQELRKHGYKISYNMTSYHSDVRESLYSLHICWNNN